MVINYLKKLIGTRNERVLKGLSKIVAKTNSLEPEIKKLSDAELTAKTPIFRDRFTKGEPLESMLPEVFACVREAAVRALGQRHFDVQLIGGMVLHEGKIAEMRTGEGKTLVATLTACLNAMTGQCVHVVTVNDYLARRDADWMGPIYNLLGLTVGVIKSGQSHAEKKAAYACDIVYGTNNEFGFDYLRDNMAFSLDEKVQRPLYYAIVDEVDSILIDEARTPLIISGPTEDSSDLYVKINKLVPLLKRQTEENGPGDYTLDEKVKQAYLTEEGHQTVEKLFADAEVLKPGESLYEPRNIKLMHYLHASLRAHTLFNRDVDYIVRNGEIVIVDEHTGRTMDGRRWSDGLHQAVEAKEAVNVRNENQTLASITFQNYFRLYKKIAGMTGTADTEAYEFQQIYGLEVVVIPTNMPMVRIDNGDKIYLTAQEKYCAVIEDIKQCLAKNQPVLVGTSSIENSEVLSRLLDKEKIPHQVLNAKQHAREAIIISEAGRPDAVTIATNMAGRGTDIVLGGNLKAEIAELNEPSADEIEKVKAAWQKRHDEVIAAGGLHIIGSERHESRRIDNQLRGRSGRQGDPGSSRFFLSLEDNLMRIFASDRVAMFMKRLGMKENEAIEHPMITQAVEKAQRKVEGHNFDIRKQLLEFDNVANEQRKVIYSQRDEVMAASDILATIQAIREDVIKVAIDAHVPSDSLEEQWNIPALEAQLTDDFGLNLPIAQWLNDETGLHEIGLRERIHQSATAAYQEKEQKVTPEVMRQIEKSVLLQTLDQYWKEHLAAMDHLREGIHLRGYAAQNPKQEYKRESFKMFTDMLENIKYATIRILYSVQIKKPDDAAVVEEQRREEITDETMNMNYSHQEIDTLAQDTKQQEKVGRNDPCLCGSGKKYKHCHGKLV